MLISTTAFLVYSKYRHLLHLSQKHPCYLSPQHFSTLRVWISRSLFKEQQWKFMFSCYLDQKYNVSVWSCEGIENWECLRKTGLSRLEGKICSRFCVSAMYAWKHSEPWNPGKKKKPKTFFFYFILFFIRRNQYSINSFTRQKWEVGQKACWLFKIPCWVSGTLNSKWHPLTVKLINHAKNLLPREGESFPFLPLADRHH